MGLDLEDEFIETEKEMNINPFPEKYLTTGSNSIMKAAKTLGYKMQPMLKFVDPEKCKKCGQCSLVVLKMLNGQL